MAYVAPAGSPAANGEHPRLNFTAATLPALRTKIQTSYLVTTPRYPVTSAYQYFLNLLDSNTFFNRTWDQEGGSVTLPYGQSYAFAYVMGLGTITNHTWAQFRDRAISRTLDLIRALSMPRYIGNAGESYGESYCHLSVARVYDWLYPELTPEQRLEIATWLKDYGLYNIANGDESNMIPVTCKPEGLFGSKLFEGLFMWEPGLAIMNDGIWDTDASEIADIFTKLLLGNDGALTSINWVARNGGGCDSEIGYYASWHHRRFLYMLHAWVTATNKNYFSEVSNPGAVSPDYPWAGTFYQYRPVWNSHFARPIDAARQGQWGETHANTALDAKIIRFLSGALKDTNATMSGVSRWHANQVGYEPDGSATDYALYNLLPEFILGDRGVTPITPPDAGIPKSFYFGNGIYSIRTGFGQNVSDTSIQIGAPLYCLDNHSWGNPRVRPRGFSLHKYGPIFFRKATTKDSKMDFRNCEMRFTDANVTPIVSTFGFQGQTSSSTDLSVYLSSNKRLFYELGPKYRNDTAGINAVAWDFTRDVSDTVLTSYYRYYVVFRGPSRSQPDYVVILDKCVVPNNHIRKRWELAFAYDCLCDGSWSEITSWNGYTRTSPTGHYQTSDSTLLTFNNVNNSVYPNTPLDDPYDGVNYGTDINPYGTAWGADGKAFVKCLLPTSPVITKVGGTGHEFESDDGTYTPGGVPANDLTNPNGSLEEDGAFNCGAYYLDIEPSTNANLQETFLNVIEAAKASITPSANTIDYLASTMHVVEIKDPIRGKIAAFSKQYASVPAETSVTYTATTILTLPMDHVICDLDGTKTYSVDQGGTRKWSAQALVDGVLYFTSTGGGTFQIYEDGTIPPPTPTAPDPPNLVAPSNGQILTSNTVVFDWDFTGDVDLFKMQVSEVSDFATTVVNETALVSSSKTETIANGAYYWRAASRGTNGLWSDWSSVYPFAVNYVVPQPPSNEKLCMFLRS